MTRRVVLYLRAFAGWTVFVWVVFIRNIWRDHTHTTGFKVVHITLAVISLAFAIGCVVTTLPRRRAVSEPESDGSGLSGDRATSAR